MLAQVLISAMNVSEGRDAEKIQVIAGAAGEHARILDIHADADHNRSIITLAATADELPAACGAAAACAASMLDIRRHHGAHPRRGIIDVVPVSLCPPATGTGEAGPITAQVAADCAETIWELAGIPCFVFGELTDLTLPEIRKSAFTKVSPRFGGPASHPSAGVTSVGARGPLVAFNLNLDAPLRVAAAIASALRAGDLGIGSVRSLAFSLPSKGLVQVSCNLIDPVNTTAVDVFDAVQHKAGEFNTEVVETEIAGTAIERSLDGRSPADLKLTLQPKILERLLAV